MANSVALDLDNYSLNMNREYSVVQLTDHSETSSIIWWHQIMTYLHLV